MVVDGGKAERGVCGLNAGSTSLTQVFYRLPFPARSPKPTQLSPPLSQRRCSSDDYHTNVGTGIHCAICAPYDPWISRRSCDQSISSTT